jgi:SAM-dependent methyltransferase
LERFILEESPLMLATQERFLIFLNENQKHIKEGASLSCLPCGKMGELLYLDYSSINNIQLTGFDIDENAILDAKTLATEKGLIKHTSFQCKNAWSISEKNAFDLISCNGLNIYEPSDDTVTKLYALLFDALLPGGRLVTSFITPPDEWLLDKINAKHAKKEKLIFADILQSKWRSYRSEDKTKEQLREAGFSDITFIYDKAHIFPTVTAVKTG